MRTIVILNYSGNLIVEIGDKKGPYPGPPQTFSNYSLILSKFFFKIDLFNNFVFYPVKYPEDNRKISKVKIVAVINPPIMTTANGF